MSAAGKDLPAPGGLRLLAGYFDPAAQAELLAALEAVLDLAPPYIPKLPRTGRPMSVRMSNCGPLGWVTDQAGGYRYQATHPETGRPWPPIPPALLGVWGSVCAYPAPPEACLINIYGPESRLGLHVDADEQDSTAPVLSVSLGAEAVFRIGGPRRQDPTRTLRLRSGDVLLLAGEARACFHGVDRIVPGSSNLLPSGGRVNVTLRRVTRPVAAVSLSGAD